MDRLEDLEIIKGEDNGHANNPDELWQAYPKVNRNFEKVKNALASLLSLITGHKESAAAHPAQNITYSGKVSGSNVKQAIDNTVGLIGDTNDRVDNLILNDGDSSPEVTDARGLFPVLGGRLDNFDEQLAGISINIKSKGAKGDDVTNDTQIINDTISVVSDAGGGVVYFPKGTYLSSKVIAKSNVLLIGQGKLSVIKRIDAPDQTHFVIGGSIQNFGIVNLVVDVDKDSAHSFPYTDGVNVLNCGNFILDGLEIRNSINRGLFVEKNSDQGTVYQSQIKNCLITGSNSAAVLLRNCSDMIIDNNLIKMNSDSGLVVEYMTATMYPSNVMTITRNKVNDNGQMGIWCFSDSSDRHLPVGRIYIAENEVSNNGFNGVITQLNETILDNNNVHDNGTETLIGAGITANTSNVTIRGGSITGNRGSGIDLGDCSDVMVQGVLIRDNGVMGIEVNSCEEAIIDSCIIKGNNLFDYGVAFGSNNGIYVYQGTSGQGEPFVGPSKNVQIKNCIIRNKPGSFQAFGIRVGATAENVLITGCDIYDSGSAGDFKIETVKCIMDNNISRGNGFNGNTLNAANTLIIPPDGIIFFVEGSGTINNITTAENLLPKGRKITLVMMNANITIFAGNGTNGNILNNGNTNITGNLKIVDYVCLGGQFPLWLQLSASAGR
ncbi:hypothetical protein EJP82_01235 [Paenibacillus anaericanus]|uniref:Rhamnogalacturonase A/B/Epimerase-like pectate lyase domain-containing protein n=1 Tax=Paenibacillus anaericanus TaxID=170367 RepID=A0A433YFD2_9BACL|nr:right-handed parallel beta-helix repeat-containing protein [Paenibacillus anaericanus]RUT48594.1 hypothetical protein EJP82_01235 [Paenibacillus anaericanus]